MKVFITRKIPKVAEELFRENGIGVKSFNDNRPITQEEIIRECENVDGIISLLTDRFDKAVLSALNRCRVIANYAVGFNNIDIHYAKEKGIVVTNTPDILTDATADLAFTLLMTCARRALEGDRMVREGKFTGWEPELLLGMELRGKTIGIVGAGRIGQATAERAKAFGMDILYYSKSKKEDFEQRLGAEKSTLENLLKKSDVVSLHLPLNEMTNKLLSSDKLELMKRDSILINTARGEIIDEDYLIEMLKTNRIASAGLDVYENEPNVKEGFLSLKNVVLFPHLGSATVEARDEMATLSAKNVINVLKGKKAITPVN